MQGSSSNNVFINLVAGPLVKDLGIGNAKLKALDEAFAALPHKLLALNLAETKPTHLKFGIETMVSAVHFIMVEVTLLQ